MRIARWIFRNVRGILTCGKISWTNSKTSQTGTEGNDGETAGQMAMRAWKVLECGALAGEVFAYCSDPDTNKDSISLVTLPERH